MGHNRDPATLSEEEKRYLTTMMQKYSTHPVHMNPHMNIPNNPTHKKVKMNGGGPTGYNLPGQYGPIGTPIPPPQSQSAPQQREPNAVDQLMANMLSSVIEESIGSVNQQRPRSEPLLKENHPSNHNNTTSANSNTKQALQSLSKKDPVITPISLTPPPPGINAIDEIEDILSSVNSSPKRHQIPECFEKPVVVVKTLSKLSTVDCVDGVMACGGKDGSLRIISLSANKTVGKRQTDTPIVKLLFLHEKLACFDSTGSVLLYNSRNIQEEPRLIAQEKVIAFDFLNPAEVVLVDSSGSICLLECLLKSTRLRCRLDDWSKTTLDPSVHTFVCAVAEKEFVISTGPDIFKFSIDTGKQLIKLSSTVKSPSGEITHLKACDGLLLSINRHETCSIFDTTNLQLVCTSTVFPEKLYCGMYMKRENIVVLGSYKRLFLWRPTDKAVEQIECHEGIVTSVAFDDASLVSVGHDGLVIRHKRKL